MALSSAAAWAGGPGLGSGAAFTAGTRGYRRFSASADADWELGAFEPYGWSQFDVDNYQWDVKFGGGTWRELTSGYSVKGGLGVELGHVFDTDSDQSALLLEAAAEKKLGRTLLGAEYDLTSGAIGGPTVPASFTRTLHGKEPPSQSRRPGQTTGETSAQSYTYNELSSYFKFPVSRGRGGLRLTLGLPSNSGPLFSETASLRWPLWRDLSLNAALTFQQGSAADVFGSLGAYWLFR